MLDLSAARETFVFLVHVSAALGLWWELLKGSARLFDWIKGKRRSMDDPGRT